MKIALIKLHIAVFLVGFTAILGALISLSGMVLVWYRLLLTVLSLYAYLRFTNKLQKLSKQAYLRLMLFGVVIALHWVFFYSSIKLTNVSIALVCFSATGFFTAIVEPLLITKKIKIAELGLGLISIAGIYLIFHFDTRYKTGIAIGIISALLAALFSVLNKKNITLANAQTTIFYELLGGILVLSIVMPLYLYWFPGTVLIPSLSDWGWLLILSWVCTALAMQLMLEALQKVSAFTQNLSLNLEPVYGILMAFFLFHENEQVHISFYIGVSLIIFSVLLQIWLLRRAHRLSNT
ncbi:MAG: EamA family transporter [Chitinophagaceae bacterium]|nr:EamA family transporter [Chitinophagaceae bacterium]MCA6448102.1 EamA family transporter [Chitinophagaceae bacterium]